MLADRGVQVFEADPAGVVTLPAGAGDRPPARLGVGAEHLLQPTQPLAVVGTGLPALPKKFIEKIRGREYVDFADMPPAKGKSRPLSQALDGQVLVVQAADLLQTRKLIPDLSVWTQCFALYVAVLAPVQPERVQELMAYQAIIAKASTKYRWPSWIVYDQNFRQEAAGQPAQSWAKVDPSIYSLCFTGQARSSENWCSLCQSLDHATGDCPARPSRKRPWSAGGSQPWPAGSQPGPYQRAGSSKREQHPVCVKYNKYDGDCRFGKLCKFQHVCSSCREAHPASRCKSTGENRD